MAVAGGLFREIMASFPSGVAVVTAHESGRRLRGLTLSAFCPVSLSPPLVLICVDRASQTLPALLEAGGFTVNFLAAGREHLAVLYASKSDEKFDDIAWTRPRLPEGGPILHEDAAAYAVCVTRQAIEAGDHWVFIGLVVDGAVLEGRSPLLYHQRSYMNLAATSER